jgi:hypothetical protein
LAALLEAFQEFAESITENPSGAGAAKAELAKQAAEAPLLASARVVLPRSAEHLGNLVSILVTRKGEQR